MITFQLKVKGDTKPTPLVSFPNDVNNDVIINYIVKNISKLNFNPPDIEIAVDNMINNLSIWFTYGCTSDLPIVDIDFSFIQEENDIENIVEYSVITL